MATNLDQNKITTISLTDIISDTPIISRIWRIDNVQQSSTAESIQIAANALTGSTHSISCTLENGCGTTTNTLEINFTDGLLPVIINGTFNTALTPWALDNMGGVGTASVISGQAVVNIFSIGTDPGKNRFYQSGLSLASNTPYYLYFDIKSNNNAWVEAYLNDTNNPNTHIILGGTPDPRDIPTTASMVTREIAFTTPASVPADATLRFKFPTAGIYTIDNVRIVTQAVPCVPVWVCEVPANGFESDGCGNRRANTSCTVVPVLTTIEITGCLPSIIAGSTCQLTATCKDQGGNVISCPAISWGSSSNAIATISQTGFVTGVSAGTVSIAAVNGGVTGYRDVIVTALPPAEHGTLNVSSSPAGAYIVMDGVATRLMTPQIMELTPGHHVIRLVLSGYSDVYEGFDVYIDQAIIKLYTMQKSGGIAQLAIPIGLGIGLLSLFKK